MDKIHGWYLCAVLMASGLNLATIYRSEDPIRDTQTNPIKYEDKMNETKDGEKGAPLPSMTPFQKEKFLIESNLEHTKEESAETPQDVWGDEEDMYDQEEGQDEDVTGPEDEREEQDSWWFGD